MIRAIKSVLRAWFGWIPLYELRNKVLIGHTSLALKRFEDAEVARHARTLRPTGQRSPGRPGPPTALVAVVLITYKRHDDLLRAIDSVLSQTIRDLVVIVVDDGGGLPPLPEDPRLYAISLSRNVNVLGVSRNVGMRLTDSAFVAFLDDDNRWHPHHLETALGRLTGQTSRPGLSADPPDAVYTAMNRMTPDGETVDILSVPFSRYRARNNSFLDSNPFVARRCGHLVFSRIRRSKNTSPKEDWELVFRFSRRHKVEHIPEVTVDYTVNPNSYWTNWNSADASADQDSDRDQGWPAPLSSASMPLTATAQLSRMSELTRTSELTGTSELTRTSELERTSQWNRLGTSQQRVAAEAMWGPDSGPDPRGPRGPGEPRQPREPREPREPRFPRDLRPPRRHRPRWEAVAALGMLAVAVAAASVMIFKNNSGTPTSTCGGNQPACATPSAGIGGPAAAVVPSAGEVVKNTPTPSKTAPTSRADAPGGPGSTGGGRYPQRFAVGAPGVGAYRQSDAKLPVPKGYKEVFPDNNESKEWDLRSCGNRTLDHMYFHAMIYISKTCTGTVNITNSIIAPPPGTPNRAILIDSDSIGAVHINIKDSTIRPEPVGMGERSEPLNTFAITDCSQCTITITRTDIANTGGICGCGANTVIEWSWLHDNYLANLPTPEERHTDGVFPYGGGGPLTVSHNRLEPGVDGYTGKAIEDYWKPLTAVIFTQPSGGSVLRNFTLTDNFISLGAYDFYPEDGQGMVVKNNVFGPAHWGPIGSCSGGCNVSYKEWSGNVIGSIDGTPTSKTVGRP